MGSDAVMEGEVGEANRKDGKGMVPVGNATRGCVRSDIPIEADYVIDA